MSRIKLDVVGLSTGQSSGSYTLILGEENGKRKLPIVIGSFEAQAIAIEIEKIVPFRPMTHDLFVSMFRQFDIELSEVIIYNLNEGVFHAKLVCEHFGEIKEIDARTSDSIALAVRFKCPIYTYDDIMEIAGVVLQEEMIEEEDSPPKPAAPEKSTSIKQQNLEQLNKSLEDALNIEDYDLAARIRDEISKRKDV